MLDFNGLAAVHLMEHRRRLEQRRFHGEAGLVAYEPGVVARGLTAIGRLARWLWGASTSAAASDRNLDWVVERAGGD
jgi:hypothetical protein